VLLQTQQHVGTLPGADVSALQELLPPHTQGSLLEGALERPQPSPGALRAVWWDHRLIKAPIYVRPTWGLSNRLRTIAGAFVVGRAVGRNVVVIWGTSPQCPQNLTDFFQGVPSAPGPPAGAALLQRNPRTCEFRADNLSGLEQVPGDRPIYVNGCDFAVKHVTDQRYLAFHALHLQPALRAEARALIALIRRPGRRAVGVHIRQGSLQDARQGAFFGPFRRPPAGTTGLPCCTEGGPRWVCPARARPLGSYAAAMRKAAGVAASSVFFVAADRPSCLSRLERQPGGLDIVHSHLPATDRAGSNNATAAILDMYGLAVCERVIHQDPGSWTGLVQDIHRGFQQASGK